MKKTLIALAVVASAVTSGSAMAWTANGNGGSVEIGGTLTPVAKVTPWEVKVGSAVTNLSAQVQKGQKDVTVLVNQPISILGIRNADPNGFTGKPGIMPIITYGNGNGNGIDVNGFNEGVTTLNLTVNDNQGARIGSMSTKVSSAAVLSYNTQADRQLRSKNIYASGVGSFSGGLGKSESAIKKDHSTTMLNSIDPAFLEHFSDGIEWSTVDNESFGDNAVTYFAAYGCGIESGRRINITLDNNVASNADIQWRASLPVSVIYQ
ncbi:hypothetical protein ACSV3W_004556 [Escherichia coli]